MSNFYRGIVIWLTITVVSLCLVITHAQVQTPTEERAEFIHFLNSFLTKKKKF